MHHVHLKKMLYGHRDTKMPLLQQTPLYAYKRNNRVIEVMFVLRTNHKNNISTLATENNNNKNRRIQSLKEPWFLSKWLLLSQVLDKNHWLSLVFEMVLNFRNKNHFMKKYELMRSFIYNTCVYLFSYETNYNIYYYRI